MQDRPQARTEGVISELVGDDLVIYDQTSHTAHSLSNAAASVWKVCNGERSHDEIARDLSLEPAMVAQAIAELSDCGLLDDGPVPQVSVGMSRREAAKRLAQVGGAALVAPLIYSVAVPGAAMAVSCTVASGTTVTSTHCTGSSPGGFGTSVIASGAPCCSSGHCYQIDSGGTYYCVANTTCATHDEACSPATAGSPTCCAPDATCRSGSGSTHGCSE